MTKTLTEPELDMLEKSCSDMQLYCFYIFLYEKDISGQENNNSRE